MPATTPFDLAINRFAGRQHGIVTAAQALTVGTRRQIHGRVHCGTLRVVERGIYHVTAAPFTWHSRVLAACLAACGLASHRTAAVLWGLEGFRPGTPDITIAFGQSCRRPGIRVHTSRDVDLARPRRIDAIPVTGIARTLVDLGSVCRGDELEGAVFGAIDRRLLSWTELGDAIGAHGRPGRRGIAAVRAVFERNFDERVPASKLEVVFDRRLAGWRLPRPQRQFELHDADGFAARLDFAFPQWRLALETDGRSVHARREAFDADHLRRNRIRLAGWDLLVFTSAMVLAQPDKVRAQVEGAIELGRHRATDGG